MVRLQETPIDSNALVEELRQDEDGAVVLFLGTVRDHNLGRRVRYLEYHAYPEMAERELGRLERQARERWSINGVAVVHRIGRLEIGETAVAVAVSSAHRAEAFEAGRHLIDTLKHTVPIWKKEFFEGGEEWIEGCDHGPAR